ncbi:MAG: hypothetical protein FVQ83_01425 [Chloroflexi bacterium]|nr:hypothetical protein [Chloroflexota bacterium]
MRKKSFSCKNILWLFGTLCLLLAACNPSSYEPLVDNNCSPPLFELAYPHGATPSYEPTPIPLPEGWDAQLSEENEDRSKLTYVGSIVVRNDDEIWMTRGLIRFTPSTGEIKEYTIMNQFGDEFVPYSLFVAKDNTLWALGHHYVAGNVLDGLYLSRFDDEKDSFEIIIDRDGIFFAMSQGGTSYDRILEDQEGNLWFLYSGHLIRFDPIQRIASIELGSEQGYELAYHSLAIAEDGAIWVAGRWLEDLSNENIREVLMRVIRFDPLTGDVREYGSPPGENKTRAGIFLFDHHGRLWLNDVSFLEVSENF